MKWAQSLATSHSLFSKYGSDVWTQNCSGAVLWLEQVLRLTRAASAAAVDTLHDPSLLQFVLRHAADAVGGKVGITGLKMCFLRILVFWSKSVFVLSRSPGCNEGSTDSHNPASSIWQSDWDRQSSPEQCVSDLSNFIAKRNVKCHWPWYNSRTAP